nr:MAG TPA: hypothetical protein [Bacteriophage sp.]
MPHEDEDLTSVEMLSTTVVRRNKKSPLFFC